MKKLLLIALVAAGCGKPNVTVKNTDYVVPHRGNMGNGYRLQILIIDGCEYLTPAESHSMITHKGDCSNPIHHTDTSITTK